LEIAGQGVFPSIQIGLQTAYLLPNILLVRVEVIDKREHVPENHGQRTQTDERLCSFDTIFRLDGLWYYFSQHRDGNIVLRPRYNGWDAVRKT
jgi:hypothetical protein